MPHELEKTIESLMLQALRNAWCTFEDEVKTPIPVEIQSIEPFRRYGKKDTANFLNVSVDKLSQLALIPQDDPEDGRGTHQYLGEAIIAYMRNRQAIAITQADQKQCRQPKQKVVAAPDILAALNK